MFKKITTKKNVSLFWRIRKSGESRISSPWRYHLTCRGGLPRTLHSRTTTWPSDAWASCSSCTEKTTLKQADESHKQHGKWWRQEAAEDESLSSAEPRGPLDISNCLLPCRTPRSASSSYTQPNRTWAKLKMWSVRNIKNVSFFFPLSHWAFRPSFRMSAFGEMFFLSWLTQLYIKTSQSQ